MAISNNPFRLKLKPAWLSRLIERLLSLNVLADYYDRRPTADAKEPAAHVDEFLDYLVEELNSQPVISNPDALDNIPKKGALVVVANHPLGGLDGVVMSHLLRKIRPDLKVLTNELLTHISEFSELFIGVDVLSSNAQASNTRGLRQAMRHVKNGGALLVFPAGMVSAINTRTWRIEDRQWNNIVGALVQQYQATCLPFYVHGRNSRLFYAAGLLHPRLRTALLPRELANVIGKAPQLTVGSPIAWQDIQGLKTSDELTAYLRTATDLLSQHGAELRRTQASVPIGLNPMNTKAESQLARDLKQLKPYLLLSHQHFDVFCAPYEQLNSLMSFIAVARERTFRAAGEGTGLAADSDSFDPHYQHLFIWDNAQQQLVGGYRVGATDKIVAEHGVEGLYSRSLYEFDARYIHRFGGAVEVGRSFVSPEYQRHPRALDLLWRGIGAWMVNNPQYHTLFGCVSISSEHSARARAFLSESLMVNYRAEQEYLTDVRPVAPLKVQGKVWTNAVLASLSSITLINKLLGQCDPGKTIPVLLRHYLALNGRFIGFSVNHSFNDSLDGLIVVDLRKTPHKYLQRYLGKTGSQAFIDKWSVYYASA